MKKKLLLAVSHATFLWIGFVLGIYLLPILTAPDLPSAASVQALAQAASYTGTLRRDLRGSDLLHWGEGTASVGQ